ncbi:hypothetical protein PVAND_000207, partial [Polypedilum vanderplanki]
MTAKEIEKNCGFYWPYSINIIWQRLNVSGINMLAH